MKNKILRTIQKVFCAVMMVVVIIISTVFILIAPIVQRVIRQNIFVAILTGGDIYRNKVRLDFSVNTNPLGMSENVKKAIAENIEQFGIYPDAMCVNLRNAIAEKEQVGVDNVLCSNGAAEMIFAVVRAVMPKKSLLLAPTFSEYERALKSVGSQICYYYLKEKNDFDI